MSTSTDSQLNVRVILADSFRFFIGNARQIAELCIPFLFGLALVDTFLTANFPGMPGTVMSTIVDMLVDPIYLVALILLVYNKTIKKERSNKQLIATSIRLWVPFFLLLIMIFVLVGIGLALFVIPGIWLGVRLSFAQFLVVIFGMKPSEALWVSYKGTEEYSSLVVKCILAAAAIFLVLWLLLLILVAPGIFTLLNLVSFIGESTITIIGIAADTASSFLGLYFVVMLFRVFMLVVLQEDELE